MIDLDQTWIQNKIIYMENLQLIQQRMIKNHQKIDGHLVEGVPVEGDDEVVSALLTNVLLSKYCQKKNEYEENLRSAKI
jgi:hypothetical protein